MSERLDIQGGEQFLPFARSKVKSLRATGLSYATQNYSVDGVDITVRIAAEHAYIRISGGSGAAYMDSGLVNLISTNPNVTDSELQGVLHEVSSGIAYNAPFTPDGGIGGMRTNKDMIPDRQVAGIVTFTGAKRFSGRVPTDVTPSRAFSKPRVIVPDSDPPTYQPTPGFDEALSDKKAMANSCPPSIFTGRCRLFVQALYGAHMHKFALDSSDKDAPSRPLEKSSFQPTAAAADGRGPRLKLKTYIRDGDNGSYGEVLINTSTGVYIEPSTWKHMLINIEYGQFVAYPLVASQAGEMLRVIGLRMAGKFSADDISRTEAYILSSSRPDVKHRTLLSDVSTISQFWSMGYGWHWNWSGTAADIVTNIPFEQDPGNLAGTAPLGSESTHYRLSLTVNTGDDPISKRCSANVSTVAGPDRWAAPRGLWVFCEPLWALGQIIKSTPKYTNAFACSATFYVFYVGDQLNTCTLKVTDVTPSEGTRVRSDLYGGFASPDFGGHMNGYTYGEVGGYVEDKLPPTAHMVMNIKVGGADSGEMKSSHATEASFFEVSNKVKLEDFPIPSSGYNPSSPGPPISGQEGYPPYTDYVSAPLVRGSASIVDWSWDTEEGSLDYINFGQSVVVVPINDAEAAFLWTRTTEKVTKVATKTTRKGISFATCAWIEQWDAGTGLPISYTPHVKYEGAYYSGPGTTTLSEGDSSVPTTNSYVVTQNLVSRAGSLPATFGSIDDQFFDNDVELIPVPYEVRSGVSVTSPFVMSPGRITTVGGAPGLNTTGDITILTPPIVAVGYI